MEVRSQSKQWWEEVTGRGISGSISTQAQKGQAAETVSVNGKHLSISGTFPSGLAILTHLTLVSVL